MASRRKPFIQRGPGRGTGHLYAEFISELLAGTVKATALHEIKNGSRVRIEYDDPDPDRDPRPDDDEGPSTRRTGAPQG